MKLLSILISQAEETEFKEAIRPQVCTSWLGEVLYLFGGQLLLVNKHMGCLGFLSNLSFKDPAPTP